MPSSSSHNIGFFSERIGIVFSTILDYGYTAKTSPKLIDYFISLIHIPLPNCTHRFNIAVLNAIVHRIKCVKTHDQYVRIVFIVPLNVLPEVVGSRDMHGIPVENIIPVGVEGRDDAQEAGVLGLVGEDTHLLNPSVLDGFTGWDYHTVTQPLIKDVVEELHTSVHVKTTLPVHDLMSHHVRDRRYLRISRKLIDLQDCLNEVVAERKIFASDVLTSP